MHSIRVKISAISIAATLIIIASLLGVCFFSIQGENDRQSVEMMNLICQDAKKSLGKYFESIEQSVEMAAYIASDSLNSVVLVENGVSGSRAVSGERSAEQTAALDAYLAGYSDRVQEAFESVASHTNGVVTYYYCISPDISLTEHGFFFSKVGKTGFSEREPLDARELDPEDIEHTTWYYTPIQRGRPSWVGPYTAHFLNEMWISSYLVPIYRVGTLIGVLGMDLPLDTLIEQISSIRVYQTGFACLLGEDGRVIYHPRLEIGSVPDYSQMSIAGELLREEQSGDDMIRYRFGGQERQMAYATLSNGMKLVVTAPVSEINASWIRLSKVLALVCAVLIVFFTALLFFALGLITRPLQRLTAASRRLARAEYDVELDYTGRDEIGVLTLAFQQMRDKIKLYIDDLNRRIITDSLTGAPNMRHFFKLAAQERARLLEQGLSPAVLYVNLIGMKHYNRQYGFEEGDNLIRAVAGILAQHFGALNMCRFSEDHFAVMTHAGKLDELESFFAECREANGGKSLPIHVGIYPDELEETTVSIACDRAKFACDQHRGTYVSASYTFDALMLRQIENTRYVISHLDQALEERWVQVYYQPIIRASSIRISDEEALSRWIDPGRGFLSPAEFIPILENARLIYKLDLYVLDMILEKMHAQRAAGLSVVPHSLNLSRVDFDACDIVAEICRRVDAAGVARDLLTIEVTESMVGRDFKFMKAQIERLRALGFRVWMDDFGSGYSALDVLQELHFDLLKFDMRFMDRFGESRDSKIILRELVRMASSLGIETVCEGVETADEVAFLRQIGCTKLQGFYFSEPIPYAEIAARCEQGIQPCYESAE